MSAGPGTILFDRSDLGRLAIRGKDALDLLHRLTTNSIESLRSGEGTAAVFATPKGRILDWVTLHRSEELLLCLTGPGRAPRVREWIERYTFREEVEVGDWSASHGTLGLFGSGAGRTVAALFGEEAAGRPLHAPMRVPGPSGEAILARTFPLGGEGYHLTAPRGDLRELRERILESEPDIVGAGPDRLEALRIEAGLPAAGHELTEEYNPWEARLDDSISLSKGCYVGQEVIARLHTYRKVSKVLVRLRVGGRQVPPPRATIAGGGQEIGTLTSAAPVPGEDRIVGLGYVRDEEAVAGRAVDIGWEASRAEGSIVGPAR